MQSAHPWLTRYARFVVAYTMLLIFVGAMVTSLDAGLAVPDWPTTFGYNMFTYPIGRWQGLVFWEHSHRIIASVLGVLIILLAIWLAVKEKRNWVKALGWTALVVVCLQGLMGGLRVTKISISWAILHGCTAQMFFCLLVLIAAVLSGKWTQPARGNLSLRHLNSIRFWAWMVTAGVYLQLILGAIVRHRKAWSAIQTFPLNPDGSFFPSGNDPLVHLHFTHRLGAILVTVLVVVLFVQIVRFARGEPRLFRPALGLLAMTIIQIVFGAMIVLLLRASIPTSLHVINGAMILAVSFLIAVRAAQFTALSQAEGRQMARKHDEAPLVEGGRA